MNKKKEKSIKPIFKFICQGDPLHKQRKLILREGKVKKQTAEICPNKIIRMAYNQEDGVFEVDKNGKVVKITTSSEVLISFFASQIYELIIIDVFIKCGTNTENNRP